MPVERFDHYMNRCLYGGSGFYVSGAGRAGRRTGDFITSPEVGPLFGAVLARWLDEQWRALGRPEPFVVVDAGTGPGTFLRSLERAAPACSSAWKLVGVDLANGVEMPRRLDGAVVVANELLDNLVVRILERQSSGWHEVWVDHPADGGAARSDATGRRGTEVLRLLDESDMARIPTALTALPVGARAPWFEAAAAWIDDVIDRGAARVLAFDYGAPTTAELVERGGWLRTYRQHQRGNDPYVQPGSADITVDVAFDQLPHEPLLDRQANFLDAHGISELVDDGRRYWEAHAARPDLEAIMMRSRISEAAALTDPAGLGSWVVAAWVGDRSTPGAENFH